MSKFSLLSGGGAIATGGAVVVVVAAGAVYWLGLIGPQDTPSDPVPVVATPQPDQPEPAAASEPEETVVAEPTPAPEPAPTPEPAPVAPSFDVVRIEADGNTLIAGNGPSLADITLFLDDAELATTQADNGGGFVIFTAIPPADVPRVLTLSAQVGDKTILSEDQAIIAPRPIVVAEAEPQLEPTPAAAPEPKPEPTPVAQADPEPKPTPAADPTPAPVVEAETATTVDTADAPQPDQETAPAATEPSTSTTVASTETEQDQSVATAETAVDPSPTPAPAPASQEQPTVPPAEVAQNAPQQPGATAAEGSTPTATATTDNQPVLPNTAAVAPTVIIAGRDGVRINRPRSDTPPAVQDAVALDSIAYSDAGEVNLSGRSGGDGAFVRVYVDNKPVTTSRIAADGTWKTDLPEVDTGIYTLRIDEVDDEGTVTSRVETPFKREERDKLAQPQGSDPKPAVQAITVQPGSTLWAIARDRYGEGQMYVRVFEANKDRIRDPNLIYPGQIFDLPTDNN